MKNFYPNVKTLELPKNMKGTASTRVQLHQIWKKRLLSAKNPDKMKDRTENYFYSN